MLDYYTYYSTIFIQNHVLTVIENDDEMMDTEIEECVNFVNDLAGQKHLDRPGVYLFILFKNYHAITYKRTH